MRGGRNLLVSAVLALSAGSALAAPAVIAAAGSAPVVVAAPAAAPGSFYHM